MRDPAPGPAAAPARARETARTRHNGAGRD